MNNLDSGPFKRGCRKYQRKGEVLECMCLTRGDGFEGLYRNRKLKSRDWPRKEHSRVTFSTMLLHNPNRVVASSGGLFL